MIRLALLTLTLLTTACGKNTAPVAEGAVPTQSLVAGETITVNVASAFSDPDGDALTYAAASSDLGVANVAVSGTTPVTGVAAGTATVTVTDPEGLSASIGVPVTVEPSLRAVCEARRRSGTRSCGSRVRRTVTRSPNRTCPGFPGVACWTSGTRISRPCERVISRVCPASNRCAWVTTTGRRWRTGCSPGALASNRRGRRTTRVHPSNSLWHARAVGAPCNRPSLSVSVWKRTARPFPYARTVMCCSTPSEHLGKCRSWYTRARSWEGRGVSRFSGEKVFSTSQSSTLPTTNALWEVESGARQCTATDVCATLGSGKFEAPALIVAFDELGAAHLGEVSKDPAVDGSPFQRSTSPLNKAREADDRSAAVIHP